MHLVTRVTTRNGYMNLSFLKHQPYNYISIKCIQKFTYSYVGKLEKRKTGERQRKPKNYYSIYKKANKWYTIRGWWGSISLNLVSDEKR